MDAPLLANVSQPHSAAAATLLPPPEVRPKEPRVVKGLDGQLLRLLTRPVADTLAKIARFAAQAMAGEAGWADVDPATVMVEDSSGGGGSATFKVSCQSASPPCVALHSRSTYHQKDWDEISGVRKETVQALFSRYGLAPQRLVQGSDWYIEVWAGEPLALVGCTPEDIGVLLAKVHALPIEWYDETRDALVRRYGQLRRVPEDSNIWRAATLHNDFIQGMTPELIEMWQTTMPPMTSPHARRLVTCHGDFHPLNMVRGLDGEVRMIDLNQACVSNAATDLHYIGLACLKTPEQRRAAVTSYLRASGAEATAAEVEELLFDCEIRTAGMWLAHDIKELRDYPDHSLAASQKRAALLQRAREDPALRKRILQRGILGMEPWKDLAYKAMRWTCYGIVCVPLVLAPIAALGTVIYVAST